MRFSLALLCTVMFFSETARADLINGTSLSGDTVIDTTNGSEWLDLNVTDGMSPFAALSVHSSAGWRWASGSEVGGLLDEFFSVNGPDVPTFRPSAVYAGPIPISGDQFTAWADLFGLTNPSPHSGSGGWYDDGSNDLNQEGIVWTPSEGYRGPLSWGTDNHGHASYGVFLVRNAQVPEPESIFAIFSLVVFGVAAVFVRRRRNKSPVVNL